MCSCLRFNWLQSVGKGSKTDYLWLTVKRSYKKGQYYLGDAGKQSMVEKGRRGKSVCTEECFLVLDKISFAVSAVWFKLKINPLTFTVSNHLQMDHQLHFSFFSPPSLLCFGEEGAVSFF